MNEIDLGRLLPLLVIWVIWMLITRRRGKGQEEPVPAPPREEEDWVLEEELGLPPAEYDFPQGYIPAAASIPFSVGKGTGNPKPKPIVKSAAPPKEPGLKYRTPISRRELRRMIVWSEILAPPVGLRGKKEQ
jgi:hypothetical protein